MRGSPFILFLISLIPCNACDIGRVSTERGLTVGIKDASLRNDNQNKRQSSQEEEWFEDQNDIAFAIHPQTLLYLFSIE